MKNISDDNLWNEKEDISFDGIINNTVQNSINKIIDNILNKAINDFQNNKFKQYEQIKYNSYDFKYLIDNTDTKEMKIIGKYKIYYFISDYKIYIIIIQIDDVKIIIRDEKDFFRFLDERHSEDCKNQNRDNRSFDLER